MSSEWSNVPIGRFLKEREVRYKPEEANVLGLKRLSKIDFSGRIHLVEPRDTHTDMILVKKGDLVASGINVEKGAIAVYSGEEDVLATIHYSSYSFDNEEIDIQYFKWFLKSDSFTQALRSGKRAGIKTELKASRFLSMMVPLPNLMKQTEVRGKLDSVRNEIEELTEIDHESEDYIKKLWGATLRDAICGRLVPQNKNDEPASKLLEDIRSRRKQLIRSKVIREEKDLPPLSNGLPLPVGWEWTRLGEICANVTSGSTPPSEKFPKQGGIPYLKIYNIVDNKIDFGSKPQFIDEEVHRTANKRSILYPGDVIMNIVGPPLGKIAIIPYDYPEWNCNQAIVRFRPLIDELNRWIHTFLCEGSFLNSIELVGTAGQDNISVTKSKNIVIPIPPMAEQKRIISKLDSIARLCRDLEEKGKENHRNCELLMSSVLQDAFRPTFQSTLSV